MKCKPRDDDERRARIDELCREARRLAGGDLAFEEAEDCPLEMLEEFWENVVDFAEAETTTDFERLTRASIELPPPDELSDSELSAKLWEVIEGLAKLNTFLCSTDHLADRQLYSRLWHESLREEVTPVSSPNGYYMIDLVISGSEEDTEAYLRYYADERSRTDWKESFPGEPIPEHEELPYDRDRTLPRPPPSCFAGESRLGDRCSVRPPAAARMKLVCKFRVTHREDTTGGHYPVSCNLPWLIEGTPGGIGVATGQRVLPMRVYATIGQHFASLAIDDETGLEFDVDGLALRSQLDPKARR